MVEELIAPEYTLVWGDESIEDVELNAWFQAELEEGFGG